MQVYGLFSPKVVANPKSMSLTVQFIIFSVVLSYSVGKLTNILSNFKSLCIILFKWRYCIASTICLIKYCIISSEKGFWYKFIYDLRLSSRELPLQYSVTKYQLFFVFFKSINLTIFGWLIRIIILISYSARDENCLFIFLVANN